MGKFVPVHIMKTRSGGMAPFISTSALEGYEWSDSCTGLPDCQGT